MTIDKVGLAEVVENLERVRLQDVCLFKFQQGQLILPFGRQQDSQSEVQPDVPVIF